ncbi:hypothetical protein [Nannocystis punicea]|uniref:Uncharacterized protein n=1 Tax=Nannocystis punicea TaxID=2995304 RepID=A0ABY7HCU7_9BACT|nr:hypothetical protein [Nannocystis poenicansa]WAS97118.1 hypothetical protein O0S08_13300 [Nannocystis poenicansa]
MQIQREKFFALTASLAGFWPNAGCMIDLGGVATEDSTTTTPASTTATTASTTEDATPAPRRPTHR